MFHRRKYYIVKKEFVEIFNEHFNKTNLPNQLTYGSRLIGRWMKENDDETVEIFAIWEYDSYEDYIEIESKIRNDHAHVERVADWYTKNGGREYVLKEYILEVRNEAITSTVQATTSISSGGSTSIPLG